VTVSFADEEPNGLADLLGRLIAANLDRHPELGSLLRPSTIQLTASDADATVTIRIVAGATELWNGPAKVRPHLRVTATSADLLELSAAPLLLGLPHPFRPEGRAVIRRLATRGVRVSGMFRHPIRLSRLTRLLSVAG
jgi:hypothetical protein